ncbi:galactosyltransferase-related protein [Microbacterium sp. ET2]|uniref:glycosyltransferase family 2 protein n=1 Tax=Microbacterium albipurpureum TaxID=3050384 RepID=UPI00259CE10A|nr:galactosyltransferase-related protein [Microbacterium sp. ET2 (Ac-2212)]WJL96595.1 galactosyltransferase-related protein [Microbacterium sp. ET2 (Ac-2212)]
MTGRVAVVTAWSRDREDHLRRQRAFLSGVSASGIEVLRIDVGLDADPASITPGVVAGHVPPGSHGVRVGAARNEGARIALDHGAEVLVFLDVDCLPGPEMLSRYVEVLRAQPSDIVCGPVTYLASPQRPGWLDELDAMTRPHPARPNPEPGETRPASADEYDLFWSLSFAVTAMTWRRLGGFDEVYEGYGAEDTHFARRARASGVGLRWVGGAHAYHQWHPAGSPPWRHLDDILRNGELFARTWGEWPMRGWIEAFVVAGAVEEHAGGFRRAVV